jgi:hypothetical protein
VLVAVEDVAALAVLPAATVVELAEFQIAWRPPEK